MCFWVVHPPAEFGRATFGYDHFFIHHNLYRLHAKSILFLFSGPPDPVSQCNVTNKTFNALFVACKAGYDGGLRQTFIIEVYQGKYYDDFVRTASGTSTTYEDLVSHPIKRLEVIHRPVFEVRDLPTGTGFAVVVYAMNEKVKLVLF